MPRYQGIYTKFQIKLTPDSLLSIAAEIFFIISSTSRDILKIALLIIITSHNSHIRPMLINCSNFSFADMVGVLASSLGERKTHFVAKNFRMTFLKKKNRFNARKFLMTFLVIDGILWILTVK